MLNKDTLIDKTKNRQNILIETHFTETQTLNRDTLNKDIYTEQNHT